MRHCRRSQDNRIIQQGRGKGKSGQKSFRRREKRSNKKNNDRKRETVDVI